VAKVKMLHNGASQDTRVPYLRGDVVELDDLEAIRMTSNGAAEYVQEDEEPQAGVVEPTE
jgi:hypothetical protein